MTPAETGAAGDQDGAIRQAGAGVIPAAKKNQPRGHRLTGLGVVPLLVGDLRRIGASQEISHAGLGERAGDDQRLGPREVSLHAVVGLRAPPDQLLNHIMEPR